MNNRTMATVYVDQDSISVKTRSRKGCSPQRFIILKKELQRLEEKKVFDHQRYSFLCRIADM